MLGLPRGRRDVMFVVANVIHDGGFVDNGGVVGVVDGRATHIGDRGVISEDAAIEVLPILQTEKRPF
jgi:hypothetical protein